MSDATFPDATSFSDAIRESTRSLAHATRGSVLPAPLAVDAITNLMAAASMQPQVFEQIATAFIKAHSQFEMTRTTVEIQGSARPWLVTT